MSDSEPTVVEKKGRGRPPAGGEKKEKEAKKRVASPEESSENGAKRGRGRPKGTKKENDTLLDENGLEIVKNDNTTQKKRGRKPKIPENQTNEIEKNSSDENAINKRYSNETIPVKKRGRPSLINKANENGIANEPVSKLLDFNNERNESINNKSIEAPLPVSKEHGHSSSAMLNGDTNNPSLIESTSLQNESILKKTAQINNENGVVASTPIKDANNGTTSMDAINQNKKPGRGRPKTTQTNPLELSTDNIDTGNISENELGRPSTGLNDSKSVRFCIEEPVDNAKDDSSSEYEFQVKPKSGRGRPKKFTNNEPDTNKNENAVQIKKRGRPFTKNIPRDDGITESQNGTENDDMTVVPKNGGRPPTKHMTGDVPEKRGRPFTKNIQKDDKTTESQSTSAENDAKTIAPKKHGRPATKNLEEDDAEISPKKRGRPTTKDTKEKDDMNIVSAKKRGRPSMKNIPAKNDENPDEPLIRNVTQIDVHSAETLNNDVPVKKRGRPSMKIIKEQGNVADFSENPDQPLTMHIDVPKKNRGRPSTKNDTEINGEQNVPAKKRGRPSMKSIPAIDQQLIPNMVQIETLNNDEKNVPVKKRGRPSMKIAVENDENPDQQSSTHIDVPKKKRGRPSTKNITESNGEKNVPAKKRGRPSAKFVMDQGNVADSSENPDNVTEKNVPAKKRGRPSMKNVAAKGDENPDQPLILNHVQIETLNIDEKNMPVKKRGRPLMKIVVENDDENPEQKSTMRIDVSKKKRGRPSTKNIADNSEENMAPKKRGRPSMKSFTEKDDVANISINLDQPSSQPLSTHTDVSKKKRGRPSTKNISGIETVKKSRGRPKSVGNSSIKMIGNPGIAKKKPGRPVSTVKLELMTKKKRGRPSLAVSNTTIQSLLDFKSNSVSDNDKLDDSLNRNSPLSSSPKKRGRPSNSNIKIPKKRGRPSLLVNNATTSKSSPVKVAGKARGRPKKEILPVENLVTTSVANLDNDDGEPPSPSQKTVLNTENEETTTEFVSVRPKSTEISMDEVRAELPTTSISESDVVNGITNEENVINGDGVRARDRPKKKNDEIVENLNEKDPLSLSPIKKTVNGLSTNVHSSTTTFDNKIGRPKKSIDTTNCDKETTDDIPELTIYSTENNEDSIVNDDDNINNSLINTIENGSVDDSVVEINNDNIETIECITVSSENFLNYECSTEENNENMSTVVVDLHLGFSTENSQENTEIIESCIIDDDV